jgi:hypothetical protein
MSAVSPYKPQQAWVAPQRCPVYATTKVLTKFWMIIPFTLKYVQNLIFDDSPQIIGQTVLFILTTQLCYPFVQILVQGKIHWIGICFFQISIAQS